MPRAIQSGRPLRLPRVEQVSTRPPLSGGYGVRTCYVLSNDAVGCRLRVQYCAAGENSAGGQRAHRDKVFQRA